MVIGQLSLWPYKKGKAIALSFWAILGHFESKKFRAFYDLRGVCLKVAEWFLAFGTLSLVHTID